MYTLVVFIVALVLIVLFFVLKNIELSSGRVFIITSFLSRFDGHLLNLFKKIKLAFLAINFTNAKLIFSKIIVSIRKSITTVKRRFDHKHSPFFVKKEHNYLKNKGSVSFFLKDISEHKKSLKNDNK